MEASNFGGKGPRAVGNGGIGPFGTYDTAGNVREWCWNAAGADRWILGGSWDDEPYMFSIQTVAQPFDRSPQNGFRLVKYLDGEPEASLTRQAPPNRRDYRGVKPISDEVFEAYRHQYSPIRSELDSKVEARDETPDAWVREKITFDAGYGEERMIAYLFLPKRSKPPHQLAELPPDVDGVNFIPHVRDEEKTAPSRGRNDDPTALAEIVEPACKKLTLRRTTVYDAEQKCSP